MIIDTSALYPLILELKEKFVVYAVRFSILNLTIYEVGNVLWKVHERGKIRDVSKVARLFKEMFKFIRKISIEEDEIEEVLKIVLKKNITFYDASYIYAAEKNNYTLITEDYGIRACYDKALGVRELIEKLFKE